MSTDRECPPDRENIDDYIVPIPTSLDQALRLIIPRYVPGAFHIRVGWTRDILRVRAVLVVTEVEMHRALNWFEAAAVKIASKLRDEARNPPPPAVSE